MSRDKDIQHSILIVSSSEQFTAFVKKSLVGFITIDVRKSISLARRMILERDYDLVVIDAPLSDESGESFALDVAERMSASVMILIPQEMYSDVAESVADYGILTVTKPTSPNYIDKSIRFMTATRDRLKKAEKKIVSVEEKMEELRCVSRAKLLLVERKKMTESDAHRYIGKLAMDNGTSRKRIAERIIEDLGD
ncbi:MAG: response regulator [Lachnospiraceae bacterium]|nr:response regulator [Lachnospiraceae bacterium]